MIEKFNGIVYLIIFIVHFLVYAVYAFRAIVGTKSFMDQYNIDHSAAVITRFFGAPFVGSFLMAIYIMFVRDGGVNGTWAFFNLVFIMNVSILVVNFYTLKIDKTGLTKKTRNDGIYAPLVLVIISAILCYGLADKIYV